MKKLFVLFGCMLCFSLFFTGCEDHMPAVRPAIKEARKHRSDEITGDQIEQYGKAMEYEAKKKHQNQKNQAALSDRSYIPASDRLDMQRILAGTKEVQHSIGKNLRYFHTDLEKTLPEKDISDQVMASFYADLLNASEVEIKLQKEEETMQEIYEKLIGKTKLDQEEEDKKDEKATEDQTASEALFEAKEEME